MKPWRRCITWFGLGLALLLGGPWPPAALAQGIESVLSPGKLIQGHARWDDECTQCHVRFDRGAQDRLCMNCHKDVAGDVAGRIGWHGRQKPQPCRACHTDHKGRGARIAAFDTQGFDHSQTDHTLRGAHQKVECAKCHQPPAKYRDAPRQCNACHRADDVHKGSLGAQCADCHTENRWKETRFDHDKTRFSLTGRHVDTACTDCHRAGRYKDTPRTCVGCHRADDDAKGHKGQFGDKCESCHGTAKWKESLFNHDTDTRYVLRGKHRNAGCGECHTAPLFKVKPSQACVDCHRRDDKHEGSLGRECGSCHTERDWKEKAKFDHARTDFPLLGKHALATCQSCHKSSRFKETPKACVDCHRQDDKHQGTLGTACGDCHQERDWKTTQGRFDHERTQFKLRNAHAQPRLACNACHKDLRSFRRTPTDCHSCHRAADKHAGQLGTQCESCHTDRDWKTTRFDHARSRFPLLGRHLTAACKDCHQTPRFKDAKSECIACHLRDDKHRARFGTDCASCHNARAWAIWSFDHDKRSRFRLEGLHKRTACESCHTQPAPAGKALAPIGDHCAACHRRDDPHDGNFGTRCEQCHVSDGWKQLKQGGAAPPSKGRGWLQ